MKKVEVINLIKHDIVIRKKRSKNKIFIASLFLISFLIIGNFTVVKDDLRTLINRATTVYNPVNSLYNDNSSAIFTSGALMEKEALNFIIPIKTTSCNIGDGGELCFDVTNSIMVMACEDGVVEDIGTTLDGVKFIKIKHTIGIYSVLENLEIIGVAKGNIVKKGEDIATATQGNKITLKIYENDILVSNLKINQSKIEWKN